MEAKRVIVREFIEREPGRKASRVCGTMSLARSSAVVAVAAACWANGGGVHTYKIQQSKWPVKFKLPLTVLQL